MIDVVRALATNVRCEACDRERVGHSRQVMVHAYQPGFGGREYGLCHACRAELATVLAEAR